MNGVMFGGEGPMMKGTWYNPNTGDVFTVRDSFFEDNNYVVTTTDGRYLSYNQIQNYVQSDTPASELKAMMNKSKQEKKEEIPAELKDMIATDDDDSYDSYMIPDDNIYAKPLGNINNTPTVVQPAVAPVNVNKAIIEKALKNTTGAKLTVIVDWPDYPEKEISLLTDIMDIPAQEIAEWYCNEIDTSWMINDIKSAIYDKIVPQATSNTVKDDIQNLLNSDPFEEKTPVVKHVKASGKKTAKKK